MFMERKVRFLGGNVEIVLHVEAMEHLYAVCRRKYGITIAELELLNLMMGESLNIGEEIKVPKKTFYSLLIVTRS